MRFIKNTVRNHGANHKLSGVSTYPFQIFGNGWGKVMPAPAHEDATFVNRFAHYVRGVDEIVALHESIHETIYRDPPSRTS